MSATARTVDGPSRDWRIRLWGALAIAAFAVVFLWEPISRIGETTFTPCDFLQDYALTRVEDGWRPKNALISDVSVEYHPWYLFDREQVLSGHLPLWNRLNGCGVPHLANFQSAVFSPLTLAYYAFSFKVAAVLTAFLKLFGLGFFTFLFLRELRLSFLACVFGGTIYMFTGHNMLRLGYSQSAVAMLAPAGLWALERLALAFERSLDRAPVKRSALWLQVPGATLVFVAVVVSGLLFGHPETFYFALATLVIYAIARTFALWRDHRAKAGATRRLAWLGAQLFASGILAAGICAITLLPFFEYLRESFILGDRGGGGQTPLATESWPCLLFPNLLGNPSQSYYLAHTLPRPDFDTVTLAYVGAVALFLAAAALFWESRRRVVVFFALLGCTWVVYAYALLGSQPLFELIPTVEMVPINRSQILGQMCVAVCAGFALDGLSNATRGRNFGRALGTLIGGLAVLFLFRAGAIELAATTWKELPPASARDQIPMASLAHLESMSVLFVAGIACAAFAWIARAGLARKGLCVVIVLVTYAETGALFDQYNPATPDRLVYPRTPELEELAQKIGEGRAIIIGNHAIPPHVNMVYGLSSLAVWDGMNIRRLEDLRRRLFSEGGNWQTVTWGTTRGLELFGFDQVFSEEAWIPFDTVFGFVQDRPDEEFATDPLVPGQEVRLDFTGADDALEAIRICFVTGDRPLNQTIDLVLADRDSGEVIAKLRMDPEPLALDVRPKAYRRLAFQPLTNAKKRHLRLTVSSTDGTPENAWSIQCRRDFGWMANLALWRCDGVVDGQHHGYHSDHGTWEARQGETALNGLPVIDMHLALRKFKPGGSVGPYVAYRYEDAVARYHTVSRVYVAPDDDAAWTAVLKKAFDPAQTVVLQDVDASFQKLPGKSRDANEPVEIVSESHGAIRLRTKRADAGWLVIAQPWYPGWKARVNGVETNVERANYAFSAVKLPAGESSIALDYDPASVRLGGWTSLASLVAFIAWVVASRRMLRPAA